MITILEIIANCLSSFAIGGMLSDWLASSDEE